MSSFEFIEFLTSSLSVRPQHFTFFGSSQPFCDTLTPFEKKHRPGIYIGFEGNSKFISKKSMCMQYRSITHFSSLLNSNEWKKALLGDVWRLYEFCVTFVVDDLRDFHPAEVQALPKNEA
jgi:hypothetical protein